MVTALEGWMMRSLWCHAEDNSAWKMLQECKSLLVLYFPVLWCFSPIIFSAFFFASCLHMWSLLSVMSLYLSLSCNLFNQSLSSLLISYLKIHCVSWWFKLTVMRTSSKYGLQEKTLWYLPTCKIQRSVTVKNKICQCNMCGNRMPPTNGVTTQGVVSH